MMKNIIHSVRFVKKSVLFGILEMYKHKKAQKRTFFFKTNKTSLNVLRNPYCFGDNLKNTDKATKHKCIEKQSIADRFY